MLYTLSQYVKTKFSPQWPESYDWEATRAINAPSLQAVTRGGNQTSNQDLDEKEKDRDVEIDVKEASITDSFDAVRQDEELDPMALDKAFRFASLSSIALVSYICHRRS